MKWEHSIVKSNNLDGSTSYSAVAEFDDGDLQGCVESKWGSKEEAEASQNKMKKEL